MPRSSSVRRRTTSCGGSSRCPLGARAASPSGRWSTSSSTRSAEHHAALPLVSAALADVWERRDGDTLDRGPLCRDRWPGGGRRTPRRAGCAAGRRCRGDPPGDDAPRRHHRRGSLGAPAACRRRPAGRAGLAVDALVDARLVRRDETVVDVVHEVVFSAWPRLVAWLDEARADLVLDRELRAAARAWDARGRSDDDVYRGARLAAAAELAARHPDLSRARRGVRRRRRARRRPRAPGGPRSARPRDASRRRLGRALGAVAILLAGALVAGALAIVNERRADRQRERATAAASLAEDERARAQVARLVAESERELDSHLDLALLLAVEARRRGATPDTDGALLTALTHNMAAGLVDSTEAGVDRFWDELVVRRVPRRPAAAAVRRRHQRRRADRRQRRPVRVRRGRAAAGLRHRDEGADRQRLAGESPVIGRRRQRRRAVSSSRSSPTAPSICSTPAPLRRARGRRRRPGRGGSSALSSVPAASSSWR